ncbi:phosphatidylinositol-glycan biosynthesis class X protein [Polymixia lowei]
MYFALFTSLAYLTACNCWTTKDEKNGDICGLSKQWLESTSVSMEINKKGFHRELVNTVQFSPDVPGDLKVLLVHRWPSGIYVDPYQLASLNDHSDLQILLDYTIDLEVPAHKTVGFVALVYPTPDGQNPRLLKATIPIHGRYHEPSFVSTKYVFVNLGAPELLLRTDTCTDHQYLEPHSLVDAPCTAANSSMCSWVTIQHQQEQGHASLQIPVGDGSLVIPVCTGTLLVTMMCCVALSKNIWKHGIF